MGPRVPLSVLPVSPHSLLLQKSLAGVLLGPQGLAGLELGLLYMIPRTVLYCREVEPPVQSE